MANFYKLYTKSIKRIVDFFISEIKSLVSKAIVVKDCNLQTKQRKCKIPMKSGSALNSPDKQMPSAPESRSLTLWGGNI
jgi:hypothetical protein